ncbi:MAG: PAS domain-containing protein [Gemmatimonadota bacterium]|nr:PAS domain-containing protein [Gemmatimonadota bacterium]
MKEPPKDPAVGSASHGPAAISSPEALRHRADEIMQDRKPEPLGELPPADTRQVIHELRVHQIELELQNEELRRTQESLEASRSRYFDLYDLAPVSYFTVSEEGTILEVNLSGSRLLDVARDALVGRPLNLFILPEDQDSFYLATRQLVNTERAQAFELRMNRRDGQPFWVWIEATAAQDDDANPVLRMVLTDITARKQTEQALRTADALRDSWTYYRQMIESLPQLVWTSGAGGEWDYLGPQWLQYTGFPADGQKGLGWARQLHPDDRAAAISSWNHAVAAGTALAGEYRIRRHDGAFHRFAWRAVPLRNEMGTITRWLGTNTDLEDQAPAEPDA